VRLLRVRVQVVHARHPEVADWAGERFLAGVDALVQLELLLIVELLFALGALMEEDAAVLVLAVLPLVPVFVPGTAYRANIPWLVPVYSGDVVFNVVPVLGGHITTWLRATELSVSVHQLKMSPEWFFSLDDSPADVAREWRGFMHACDVFLQEVWTSKRFPAYITFRVTGEVCLSSGGAPLEVAGQGWTLPHHPHLATPNSRAHVVPLQQAVGYPRVLLLNVQSKFSFLVELKITKVDITTVFLCPRSNLSVGPRFVRQRGELDEGGGWKRLEGEGALVAHISLLKQHSRTFFCFGCKFYHQTFQKGIH